MRYAEHHCHTHFSALDGVSTADEYFKRAKEIGVEHISITDHATLGGHHEAQEAANKYGLSVGLGLEGYLSATDRFDKRPAKERDDGTAIYNHQGVIALNETGLRNLQAINQKAWTEGYYYRPRFDMELLEEHKEGLVVLSGCLSGVIAKSLDAGDYAGAKKWAERFKSIFKDNYYIEVMAHNPLAVAQGQFRIADELGIKVIATSDCHHASPDDLVLQEAMLILQTSPKLQKDFDFDKAQKMDMLDRFNYLYPDRTMTFTKYDLHLHQATDHLRKFKSLVGDRTDYIENTIEIADKVEIYPVYKGIDLLPRKFDGEAKDVLRELVITGAKKRGTYGKPEYDERRDMELDVIAKKNFDPYFIIKHREVMWVKEQGIRMGPGRGSGAGSLVNYELEITNVDPIPHKLLFSRFLDEFRPDWPDIDSDYQDNRREEVKVYYKAEYGHTGNIQTYTYLEGKNILKDACTVLKIPWVLANKVSSKIADWDEYLESDDTEVAEFRKKYPEVAQLGNRMRGRLRSVGMHAGGVVLSSEPLSNYAAVEAANHPNKSVKGRVEVLAMDGDRAADLGLIKYDVLGLVALTNIQDTVDMIEQRHGVKVDLDTIDMEEKAVYKSITKKSTAGLFQLEGSAFTKILEQMPIEEFNDLVTSTSLIRPGAADSSFGARFLSARNGGSWSPYCEPMREFTSDTFGEILYQEQLMLTCTQVAGMSEKDANKVRKIIGKKRDVKELGEYKDKFVQGATKYLGKRGAVQMWNDFEKSANYQFNKSHAVAYSVITYQTAWLKHHYPIEFMYALLKRETNTSKRMIYLNECKRLGITVLLPHVEHSDIHMTIEGNALRLGLTDVKNVGPAKAHKILAARPFGSHEKFMAVAEAEKSGIDKRSIESLDKIGGLMYKDHPLRGDERSYFYEYLNIPSFDTTMLEPHLVNWFDKIENYHSEGTFVFFALTSKIERKNGWARVDLFDESGTAGIFFDPGMDIPKGQYYIFLIANGSILKMIDPRDINDGSPFNSFLNTEKLRPFEGERIVEFATRRSRKGKLMGTLVTTNSDKRLESYTVYENKFYEVYTLAQKYPVVQIRAKESIWKDKVSIVLEDIKCL